MAPANEPAHYSYLLPPGWVRVDLRGDLAPQVDAVLGAILEEVPRDDRTKLRVGLRPQLLSALEQAAAGGAYDMVVPVPHHGVVGMSTLVVSPLTWPPGVDAVEGLTALAASDPTAELKDVADLVALRIHSTVERSEAAQPTTVAGVAGLAADLPDVQRSRRIQYFVGDPDRPADWITVLFSIPAPDTEPGRQWVDAEVELFDGIMSTVRFSR